MITFHSLLVTGFFNHMFHKQLHYSTCLSVDILSWTIKSLVKRSLHLSSDITVA